MPEQTGLERLKAKYEDRSTSSREETYEAFDQGLSSRTDRGTQKTLERLSQAPRKEEGESGTAELYGDMARVELELADLAQRYGKLNVEFTNLVGKNAVYSAGEAAWLIWYSLPVFGDKKKLIDLKVKGATKKGANIEILVNKIVEVVDEQHQKSIEGKERIRDLQIGVVGQIKTLNRNLVERLSTGYTGSYDHAEAEEELKRLESELTEIGGILTDYEGKVQTARDTRDVEKVKELVGEMNEVLEYQEQILDGRLQAEGVHQEIRRDILESAEGVQSAKGALARANVTYQIINGLIDTMDQAEFKYRHFKEDLVPLFKVEAAAASIADGSEAMQKRLVEISSAYQNLSEGLARTSMRLSEQAFNLTQMDLAGSERAKELEGILSEHAKEMHRLQMEWAEAENTFQGEGETSPYIRQV